MEENKNAMVVQKDAIFKHKLLNICVLVFVAVMTFIMLIAFFVLIARDRIGVAHGIVGTYVLCMLLAAPTLKVFLDKIEDRVMKRLNIVALVSIFAVILLIVSTVFIAEII